MLGRVRGERTIIVKTISPFLSGVVFSQAEPVCMTPRFEVVCIIPGSACAFMISTLLFVIVCLLSLVFFYVFRQDWEGREKGRVRECSVSMKGWDDNAVICPRYGIVLGSELSRAGYHFHVIRKVFPVHVHEGKIKK